MQFWFAALAASPLPKESTLAPSAQMSPEWHNAFSKADANKDGSLTYHEFATIAGAQVGLLAVGKGKGTAMEFCAPGQKKIESCVDDKLDFVFEGGCAKGFHTAYITPDAYDVTVDDQHGGFSTGKPIEVTGIPGHYLNKFFVDEIDVGKSHAEISCEKHNITKIATLTADHGGFAKELSCANQGFTVTSKYTCEECAPGFEPNKDESCQHGACLSGCHPVAPYTAPTTPP